MMKHFFKDMPKNDRLNKKSVWKIEVYKVYLMRDKVVYSKTYTGKLWVAYLKVRVIALLKDWQTHGNYYGINWRLYKEEVK